MRRIFVVLTLLLFGAQAWAHEHKMEAFVGPSAVFGSVLGGPDFSYVLMCRKTTKDGVKGTSDWAFFADFGTNWGSHEGEDRTQVAATMGLRRVKHFKVSDDLIIQPYLHGEVAYVWTQDEGASAVDKVGGGVGGGVDFCFHHHNSICARAQYDYVWLKQSEATDSSYKRLSIGMVFRIGCYNRDPSTGNCKHD